MTDNQPDAPDPKPRFSQEQYDMLLRCSERMDVTEWNEWRTANPDEEILLEGALLDGAVLISANLSGAYLRNAHLQSANLSQARISDAILAGASLEGAMLDQTRLNNVRLEGAKLTGARMYGVNLSGTILWSADLTDAELPWAHLEAADLSGANLKGADFSKVVVNEFTLITGCKIDSNTDFTTVPLDTPRIDPGLKQLLQRNIRRNIRRKNWEAWYKDKPELVTHPVRTFWWLSDYGESTIRIVYTFFILAGIFAASYLVLGIIFGFCDAEGPVANLFETSSGPVPWHVVPIRALYFSIVTMTTLGFGDMHAAPGSILGHVLLMIQVLLGYILLGVLVTRFAVLFTDDGPPG